jgi:hypothetical protein
MSCRARAGAERNGPCEEDAWARTGECQRGFALAAARTLDRLHRYYITRVMCAVWVRCETNSQE